MITDAQIVYQTCLSMVIPKRFRLKKQKKHPIVPTLTNKGVVKMNQWFMSYKIYHKNGGVFENFELYGANSSQSAIDVIKTFSQKLAQEHGVTVDQIMFVSFNKV